VRHFELASQSVFRECRCAEGRTGFCAEWLGLIQRGMVVRTVSFAIVAAPIFPGLMIPQFVRQHHPLGGCPLGD